jgi:phosphoglycerate dehydrogenase-like enzyme
MDELAARGVAVTNAGGIHAPGIAEQAIANMLVFTRRLHEGWRRKGNNEWRHFQSDEFTDSTVTVVGLGSIGQALVQRLQGFEVETIGVRYTPEKGGPTDEVVGFDEDAIHDALSRSEYVVVACPLNDLTRGLVGEAEFATMPPNAVLVNAARGGIVDTDALVSALQSNKIRGAALDVTDPEPLPNDHELWDLENCLVTPHTGGHTPKHWDRLADIVAENVSRLESGGELVNEVLAPGAD